MDTGNRHMTVVIGKAVLGILIGALVAPGSWAQEAEGQGDVQSGQWVISQPATVETYRGETCIRVVPEIGPALEGLDFASGTIEMDVASAQPESFVGVDFRVDEDGKRFERVYFRPGASGTPNAIQYDPHYNGYSNWQTYNPPLHEATASLPQDGSWVRIRIEVLGGQAQVFVGDADEPQLVVEELLSGSAEGAVRLWAGQASGFFANIDIRAADDTTTDDQADPEAQPIDLGLDVTLPWRISEPFVIPGDMAEDTVRVDALQRVLAEADPAGWDQVQPEDDSGLINLNRVILDRPAGNATVLAGVLVLSEEAQTKQLLFDSAEGVVVFLNGQPVYTGNDLIDRPAWRVVPDQHSVALQLEDGRNQLVLAVSSQRFGWAFLGRLPDTDGLTIQPVAGAE